MCFIGSPSPRFITRGWAGGVAQSGRGSWTCGAATGVYLYFCPNCVVPQIGLFSSISCISLSLDNMWLPMPLPPSLSFSCSFTKLCQGRSCYSHGELCFVCGRDSGIHFSPSLLQCQVKSSHLYLYSAFNNTNCNKALYNIKIGKFVNNVKWQDLTLSYLLNAFHYWI